LILKKEKDRIKKNLIFSCAIAILASLGSPFSKVIVFIVSHFSHVAPKSVSYIPIGVRVEIMDPRHSLQNFAGIKGIFRLYPYM
jgi:hypothetical protein